MVNKSYRYMWLIVVRAQMHLHHHPILGEIPGIAFLRPLAARKVGYPEDIVFGKNREQWTWLF